MIFTKEYNDLVEKKWLYYIKEGHPMPPLNPDIRSFIYDSWKRSKAYNVSPLKVKDKLLSAESIRRTQKENRVLIRVAHSYIQHLYSFIKGTNFVLALADAKGFVIDLVGDDTMIQTRTKKSGLRIGCCRSEEYAGTNGIGTCLTLGKPIQIWGYEHYIEPHHGYVCSAAPIRDPNGKVIGCLDVVGPIGLPHNHTLAMVSASADAIEKELKMAEAYERMTTTNRQLVSTIQAIDNGVILLDKDGQISQHNKRACQIMKLPYDGLHNENLSNIIDIRKSSVDPLKAAADIQNREVTLTNCRNEQISLILSLSIIRDKQKNKIGTVLVFSELINFHRLVNRLSGFNAKYTFDSILGKSPAVYAVKKIAHAAAKSHSNVLILGESGTGKELIAQAIHNASSRSSGPFIAINCGSLPKALIESELFGYEPGAFTGASREGQPGKFELASGGTIFLDEIGDMPLELQASLLRVLQSKEVVRIGGKQSKKIDVRIMAATNIDLQESVHRKEFRADLYYRLNVLYIHTPPLRERKSDIILLAYHFLESASQTMGKQVSKIDSYAQKCLENYSWPGNIRELENVIERAVNLSTTSVIGLSELPSDMVSPSDVHIHTTDAPEPTDVYATILDEKDTNTSIRILTGALEAERGNVSRAAERLGISKRTLYRRINKHQIDLDKFRLL